MTVYKELFEIADRLAATAAAGQEASIQEPLSALESAANAVGLAFSGSWLGYHSWIYYADLQPPPPGAHFSQEWGLMRTFGQGTVGDWREYGREQVKEHIREWMHHPDLSEATALAAKAREIFQTAKAEVESILQMELESRADGFLEGLRDQLRDTKPLTPFEVIQTLAPKGQVATRDMVALGKGTQAPPHIEISAEVMSIQHAFDICKLGSDIVCKAASHLERKSRNRVAEARIGTNVFIGHGRAMAWKDLKDFVQDRLKLPWDEFNRVPVAGVTNIARLSEMLNAAAIAFLVMTAEDERMDGKSQARMNVIHEAGLFQGRLGFARAIVLLEEGCEEFSNIAGLGQIRFPQGNIAAAFEEIRRVLEREGLIQ